MCADEAAAEARAKVIFQTLKTLLEPEFDALRDRLKLLEPAKETEKQPSPWMFSTLLKFLR